MTSLPLGRRYLVIGLAAMAIVGAVLAGGSTVAKFTDSNSIEMSVNASEGFDSDPIARLSVSNSSPTAGEEITLDAAGSSDDVGIAAHHWNFGDGSTANGAVVNHTFNSSGTYNVTVEVADAAGQTDKKRVTIDVADSELSTTTTDDDSGDTTTNETDDSTDDENETETDEAPTAIIEASNSSVGIGESVSFDARNSTDDNGIDSYEWDIENGSDATTSQTSQSWDSVGSYTVTLTVTDTANQTDSASMTITVEDQTETDDPPSAILEASDSTVGIGDAVTLDAGNSTDDDGIDAYKWDIEEGSVTTESQTSQSWDSVGSYTVTLTVTDTANQTDSASTTITVEDQTAPSAAISAESTNVSVNESVSFDASGSSDNVGIESYSWSLGDGSTGSGESVSHSFDSAGEYTVEVTVEDAAGNTDTASVTVKVNS